MLINGDVCIFLTSLFLYYTLLLLTKGTGTFIQTFSKILLCYQDIMTVSDIADIALSPGGKELKNSTAEATFILRTRMQIFENHLNPVMLVFSG